MPSSSTFQIDCVYFCFSADCIAGTYWSVTVGQCLPCSVNSYQSLPYQYECESCPEGTTTGAILGALREAVCRSRSMIH